MSAVHSSATSWLFVESTSRNTIENRDPGEILSRESMDETIRVDESSDRLRTMMELVTTEHPSLEKSLAL